MLVNAVYFLGKWETPFDPQATHDETFNLLNGMMVQVPTMARTGHFRHGQIDGVTVVDLPYRGRDLVMTLFIPEDLSGLPTIEERLSSETLASWIGALARLETEARLYMPRFEMEAKRALSEHLKALGMRQAFDAEAADFGGIAVPRSAEERLFISEAYHQAFVKVDEVGTEAAAATAIDMAVGGMPPPSPPEIRVDRPFLFAIRERSSGAILFLGRVVDPR